jgi:transposase
MKANSKDLRLKVLDAVDRGMNRREVVEVFGVSLPSIKRWLKMRRESGDIEARRLLTEHRKELEALAQALLERETLDEEEILEVTGLPPAPPLENRKVPLPDADSRA